MPFSRRLMRWTIRGLAALVLVLVTIVVGAAVEARYRVPDLQPWHRVVPRAEVKAADLDEKFTLADYLAREAQIFDEVRERVEDALPADRLPPANRYVRSSRSSPTRFPIDYNRTFQREPAEVRGGALLVHGLTDGPYSMRAIADRLQADGYYVLALRLPGHGTVPAGLLDVGERDWVAAVQLGMRHVRARIGDARPLVIVGYSNGGALAIRYALDTLDQPSLPRVDRLVLVSPMVGVTPMARLASVISALGGFDYFEKARWLDVVPEYNPFKYNSFPANAGRQTFEITRDLHRRMAQAGRDGKMARFPPVLTFQSLVDATVSTPAVVWSLYDRLPPNGSALVLFDINRLARLEPFIQPSDLTLISHLFQQRARAYRITVVTNAHKEGLDVAARDVVAGTTTPVDTPLQLAWPRELFSLSHVALPFPIDDPLYGIAASPAVDGPVALGLLSPRGERSVLTVPIEVLMRISSNPFFPYLADRMSEWVR